MKVAFLLVLCLAAGSQANFFDDLKSTFQNIGSALTTTLHAVGDQAKVVGTNLLSAAKDQGSQLASQALQSMNGFVFYFHNMSFVYLKYRFFYLALTDTLVTL